MVGFVNLSGVFDTGTSDEADVDVGSTERLIPLVLLHIGLLPAAEVLPVAKAGSVVVVGVPDGHFGDARTVLSPAHNRLPHIVGGVDTRHFPMTLDGINQLSHEVTVGRP